MSRKPPPNDRVPPEEYDRFPAGPDVDAERLARWLNSASVHPISAIRYDWGRGFRLKARVLPNDLWLYVERGSGSGWIGEPSERVVFRKGEMISVPAGTLHEFEAGTDTRFVSMHLRALLYGAVGLLDLIGFPLVLPAGPGAPWDMVSLRLAREHVLEAPGRAAVMRAGLTWMLHHAVRECGRLFRPRRSTDHDALPRILPALERVAENADDPELSVGELARRVHLSEQQFRKIFRRVTGARPVEFIQARRVEIAARLLRTTDLAVEEVARQAGFSDAPYFHRVFRERMRSTPRDYRLHHEL